MCQTACQCWTKEWGLQKWKRMLRSAWHLANVQYLKFSSEGIGIFFTNFATVHSYIWLCTVAKS